MSSCNYCNFRKLKAMAPKGMKVTVIPSGARSLGLGGVDVYVHPETLKLKSPVSEEYHKKYFSSWFMELPSHCCC